MGYSKQVYDRVWEILAQRRHSSREQAAARREEAVRKVPELAAVEREMARQAAAVTKVVISDPVRAENLVEQLAERNLELQERRAALLRKAGLPPNYLTERHVCPDCGDTGAAGIQRCECVTRLLRVQASAQLSQDAPLENCTFENFSLDYYPTAADETGQSPRARMRETLTFCERYARGFAPRGESLLMIGRTGLGKTHLSLAVSGVVIEQGYGVVYTQAQRMLDILEAEKFARSAEIKERYSNSAKAYLDCDLLVLDDLGAEFHTQFTGAALFNLLNSRLAEGRPTIISTNLEIAEIESRYTQRMVSRLICGYKVLSFTGKDIRYMKKIGAGKSQKL